MDDFIALFTEDRKNYVAALVYLAQAQGFRAGVRPYNKPPEPGDEEFSPVKRTVFIEFPRKTIMWPFDESQDEFLDSFPQFSE